MTPECFRGRLLALAVEYEELRARYEGVLVENSQMQRLCADAREAQVQSATLEALEPAEPDEPADQTGPVEQERPGEAEGPRKPEEPAEVADAAALATYEHQVAPMFGVSESAEMYQSESPACSDNAIALDQNGDTTRVKLNVRIVTDEPGLARPYSSEKTEKRKDTLSRTKPVVQSLYDEGIARRRRCMRHLHLLDDVSDDEDNEGDQDDEDLSPAIGRSDGSITTGEDLLLSEQIQDLWIKFAHMDKQGRGLVTGRDLNNYDQSGMFSGAQSLARMRRYSYTIEGFNGVMNAKGQATEEDSVPRLSRLGRTSTGLSQSSKSSARKGATLTFPHFVEMMLMEDCEQICGQELANDIFEIRHMFKMAGVLDLIAGKTNADHKSVEASENLVSTGCAFEGVVGVVILINAVLIGVSSEFMEDWKGWDWLEIFFGVFFFCELAWQIWTLGCKHFFCGEDWCWNFFDTVIVSMAVIDIVLMIDGSLAQKLNSITIIRMVRLFRITRMVRLMKNRYFKELTLMIRGLVHGLKTLFWAMVVLLCLVYMIGVLLRQTLGAEDAMCVQESPECDKDRVYLYKNRDNFSSVGKAMFTTFRCLVDGCSSADGTPLMIPLMNVYGWPVVIAYVLIMVFVIFGLFNLIMAIFVENTLEAAKHDEMQRQLQKSKEHVRVARKLRKLVSHFSMSKSFHSKSTTASWITKAISSKRDFGSDSQGRENPFLEITRERFESVIMEKEVANLLCDLDINVDNPKVLFDVLDVDERGSIDLEHMVTGLMQLRGSADKTDAVSCILGIRVIRKNLRSFEFILTRNLRDLWKDVESTNERLGYLAELMAAQGMSQGILEQQMSPAHLALKASL